MHSNGYYSWSERANGMGFAMFASYLISMLSLRCDFWFYFITVWHLGRSLPYLLLYKICSIFNSHHMNYGIKIPNQRLFRTRGLRAGVRIKDEAEAKIAKAALSLNDAL